MTAAENNCHPKTAASMVLGVLEELMQKSFLGQPSGHGALGIECGVEAGASLQGQRS